MSEHTPGPWRAAEDQGSVFVQSQHVRHVNATGENWHDVAFLCVTNGCGMDDARLIAAAPDLLGLLRELWADPRVVSHGVGPSEDWLLRARAIIAKATAHNPTERE